MTEYGLSSADHNKFDNDTYYQMISRILGNKNNPTPIIIDAFAGGGRDIIKMRDILRQSGKTPSCIAIDKDANKIEDAHRNFPEQFERASNLKTLKAINAVGTIAFIQDEFPYLMTSKPLTDNAIPQAKADFILCNAGIMFIKRADIVQSLQQMVDMLSPERQGQLLLGFSTKRPTTHYASGDQRYRQQDIDGAIKQLKTIEKPINLGEIYDKDRGFSWYYRLITKTPL